MVLTKVMEIWPNAVDGRRRRFDRSGAPLSILNVRDRIKKGEIVGSACS
jgi:hypothetical protein